MVDDRPSVVATSSVNALTPPMGALVGNTAPLLVYLNCFSAPLSLASVACGAAFGPIPSISHDKAPEREVLITPAQGRQDS